MCLNPHNIITPAKRIWLQGGQPFLVQVSCGHCAECNSAKSQEYFCRSYYQAQETFDKGGYMLFDTLTYKNESLPHVQEFFPCFPHNLDFSCFRPRDVRLFLVLLRRNLTKLGYDVKGGLKYFLTSEYGTSPGCTHRPHYHILFYVTIPELDPIELSQQVAKAWPHGRTDGEPYQGASYVLTKRVYRNDNPFAVESACKYVSKYVVKSSLFDKVIRERVDRMYQYIVDVLKPQLDHFDGSVDVPNSAYIYEILSLGDVDGRALLLHDVNHFCSPFHRQSQGFGLYALQNNSLDDIFKTGCIKYNNSDSIVKYIPLPTYFARKLFYNLTEDFRGQKVWKLTPLGITYKLERIKPSLDNLTNRFCDWYDNLLSSSPDGAFLQSQVSTLLNGRTFRDFVEYLALFKGRICLDKSELSSDVYIYRFFRHDMESSNWSRSYYNYTSRRDSEHFGCRVISNRYIGDSKIGFTDPSRQEVSEPYSYTWDYVNPIDLKTQYYTAEWRKTKTNIGYSLTDINTFIKMCVINDTFLPEWENFDKIYELYVSSNYLLNSKKQLAYEELEKLKDKRKQFKTNNLSSFEKELYEFIYS